MTRNVLPANPENNDPGAQAQALLTRLEVREHEHLQLLALTRELSGIRQKEALAHFITKQLQEVHGVDGLIICIANPLLKTYQLVFSSDIMNASEKEQALLMHPSHSLNDGYCQTVFDSADEVIFDLFLLSKKAKLPSYLDTAYKQGIRYLIGMSMPGQATPTVSFFLLKKQENRNKASLRLLKGLIPPLSTTLHTIFLLEQLDAQKKQLLRELQVLEEQKQVSADGTRHPGIIGKSLAMQQVFELVKQVASSDSTVLIAGESGTGKELIARAIHLRSAYHTKPMVTINCAAIPPNLIESELFGHEKGSFTGAHEKKIGKFEQANQSTIFLDEIGELPLELQAKLLRVLQEKEIERIGSKGTVKVQVRIVAASNRNLLQEVDDGKFRADLYYRLHVFPINLPPLRERREDIAELSAHFIEIYCKHHGKKTLKLATSVLDGMLAYSWPGNVRELEHLIERSVLLTTGSTIKQMNIPGTTNKTHVANQGSLHIKTLQEVEREYILSVIKLCNGRISGTHGAALKLGIPSTTLISKMQKLGIKKEHFVQAS